MGLIGIGLLVLALAGCVYTMFAAWLVGRYRTHPLIGHSVPPAISVLKPLHGVEPNLRANLESFIAQDYPAPVQIIFGLSDLDDPARAIVEALQAAHPARDLTLVVDDTKRGTNAKMSNVITIAQHIRHPLIVLADSDVAAPNDLLARLAATLADPTIGIASCLHTGRGDAGFWSMLGAMDISYRFLPSITVGIATGLAQPCLGPVMALRRETLEDIGGFQAFADVLADDYALGAAVVAHGLKSVVPRFTIVHSGDEATLGTLVRHELRWTRTIYGIDPAGFAGSLITHCLPLALIGAGFCGFTSVSLGVTMAALAARIGLKLRVDSATSMTSGPLILLPLRDSLSFVVFLATFFVNKVDWRGTRYAVSRDGRLSVE
ncbi:MAG: bacteriohopanetetrol glucosamine biosynthesis glycosyltransferase HpnI [Sphingomonadaceae bacterium]